MDVFTLTLIHTALSFLALALGWVALRAYFATTPQVWTDLFILGVILVDVTGFLLPIKGFTPAVGTGIVSSIIIILMLLARFGFGLKGWWGKLYALGIVANVFFLVLVTIAQSFLKLPELKAIAAPDGTGPWFLLAQVINLVVFAWIGFKIMRKLKRA
ncbi:hypothetical protein [Aestuariivirga litoralis]|uniref:hypothetical protein n=1 Tax=Aestuariivirga litoralis TaxID=2650924 RepID=UPI0018C81D57|nr:hypothetical protein [Aestuariivirga litoralis]MBG1233483.1 hypothetical protein [Aestuariivirga litoralis]